MNNDMDQEDNANAQVLYPRITPEYMETYRGRRVTMMGNICDTDENQSLVIQCGENQITVDNLRRADIRKEARLIEVRGVVMNGQMISCVEFTEFVQNEPFDFETYNKFVQLSFNDKLKTLFQEC